MRVLPVLILVSLTGFSQNIPLERLNASKINNSILFRLENIDGAKILTYEIDARDRALEGKNTSRSHEVDGNKLSLASTGTSFNILFDFFNPLRYEYKINHEENIDPNTIAYENFYNYVLGVAQKINSNADLSAIKSIEVSETLQSNLEESSVVSSIPFRLYDVSAEKKTNGSGTPISNESINTIRSIKSAELIDWVLWSYKVKLSGESKVSIDSLVKHIKAIEKTIYEPMPKDDLIESKKNLKIFYEPYVLQLFEDLRHADSFEDFSKTIGLVKDAIDKLKSSNQRLSTFYNAMKDVVLIDSRGETSDSYFILYTRHKISAYSDKVKGIIKNREDLLAKFEKLLQDIDTKYIATRSTPITTKPYIVKTRIGSIEKVDILITENNYEIESGVIKKTETKLYNFSLNVYEYTSVVAEFGLGTIFFPVINTSTYLSTNNTVIKSGENKLFYTPAASLNLIPNIGKGQAFWMMQLTVGSSINTPVVGIGTGVRIYNVRNSAFRNFSITGGVISCFTRQLDKLSEGATASPAVLDNDLQYSPVFRPYLGIQINF